MHASHLYMYKYTHVCTYTCISVLGPMALSITLNTPIYGHTCVHLLHVYICTYTHIMLEYMHIQTSPKSCPSVYYRQKYVCACVHLYTYTRNAWKYVYLYRARRHFPVRLIDRNTCMHVYICKHTHVVHKNLYICTKPSGTFQCAL